jgi:tryptophan 7-halogenase
MTALTIAVVGDGVAAALAAAVLARAGARVVAVPTGTGGDGLGPFGPAVIGLPDWQASELAAALGAVPASSFSLGVGFDGWASAPWFLPFGDAGAALGTLPFLQVAHRLRAGGQRVALADYSLAALAARAGRFAPPSPDPRSPLSTLAMGMHYHGRALAEALRRLVPAETSAPLTEPMIADGGITGVALADGTTLTADLYLDATGQAARLIGRLGGEWESWREWLPCDRAQVSAAREPDAPSPRALHTADANGWTATVPLDGARVTCRFSVGGAGEAYENGARRRPWTGNCVAIGAAAGLVEPVLGTPLLLAHNQARRLASLLPVGADHRIEAAEYNRLTLSELERTRDTAVALWATNTRAGEPLWDAARDRAPEPLARKLALFRSRGRVPMYDHEPLTRADWTVLLDGQGLRPRRADPLAAAVPDAAMHAHAARLGDRLAATVQQMPSHAEQLARYREVT